MVPIVLRIRTHAIISLIEWNNKQAKKKHTQINIVNILLIGCFANKYYDYFPLFNGCERIKINKNMEWEKQIIRVDVYYNYVGSYELFAYFFCYSSHAIVRDWLQSVERKI